MSASRLSSNANCVWSSQHKSPNMRIIGDDNSQVTNVGDDEKWQACRAQVSFSYGKAFFDVIISRQSNSANTWKFCIGVVGEEFDCNHQKKWIGSQGSWALVTGTGGICHDGANSINYAPICGEGDVIRVLLDFDERTISFAKNGVCFGVAFTNLKGPVYPAVSFTGKNSVLQLRVPAVQPNYPLTATVDSDQLIDWDLSGWDPQNISDCMVIENPKAPTIVKNSGSEDKWQVCRSKQMFSEGRVMFEFHILADLKTTNTWRFCLGAVPATFDIRSKQKKWVGSQGSWGFAAVSETCNDAASGIKYGVHYGQDDCIGCFLDFNAGTIEYSVNGRPQGIAFRNLKGPVYAACSFTGTGSKVYLRCRKSVTSISNSIPSVVPNIQSVAAPEPRPEQLLTWDSSNCSNFLQIDPKQPSLVKNLGSSDKWQVVTTKQTFSSGKVSIELEICLPKIPSSNTWGFCLGVVPAVFNCNHSQKWIGSQNSWGYIAGTGGIVNDSVDSQPYFQPYSFGDIIGITMDFTAKTISFSKNGVSPGIAFRNLSGPVKIGASLTATGSAIRIRILDPAPLAQAQPKASAPIMIPVAAPAVTISDAAKLELEFEYFGVLYAVTKRSRVTADDARMLVLWRQAHPGYTEEMHIKVITKLGFDKKKFENFMKISPEDERKETEQCCICLEKNPSRAFYPCGHYITCEDCAEDVKKNGCPVCRLPIKDIIKIYFS